VLFLWILLGLKTILQISLLKICRAMSYLIIEKNSIEAFKWTTNKTCLQIYGDSINEVQQVKTRPLNNWGYHKHYIYILKAIPSTILYNNELSIVMTNLNEYKGKNFYGMLITKHSSRIYLSECGGEVNITKARAILWRHLWDKYMLMIKKKHNTDKILKSPICYV